MSKKLKCRPLLKLGPVALATVLALSSAAQAEPVKLKLWLTGPGYDRFMEKVIPEFEKANPAIEVEWLNLGWRSYQQKILTGVTGGVPPDVFSFYSVDVASWASRGILKPLDDMIDRGDFIENALANGVWGPNVYALPLGMRMRPFFYRKDHLKKAGFTGPPQTWDELSAFAQKLVTWDSNGNLERTGFWVPTSHPYKTPQVWLAFLWANGGEVFTPDGKKAAFNGSEGVVATEYLADLLRKYKVDAPGSIKADNTAFAQGRVAMLVSNIVTRGLMKNSPHLKDEVGIGLPPTPKVKVVELAGEMIGISKDSKHPAEAAKLLSFIALNPPITVQYNAIDDTMPGLKAVAESEFVKNNPWIPQYLALAKYGRPLPVHPKWGEISAIITAALDEVYLNGQPAKMALDAAANKVNAVLAE